MVNTRDSLYKRGKRRVITDAARSAQARNKEPVAEAYKDRSGQATRDAEGYNVDLAHFQEVAQEGPLTKTISRMPTKAQRRLRATAAAIDKSIIFISRLAYTVWELRPWREKTPQEIERDEEMKRRQKMRRILRKEGAEYARRASNAYHRMGLSYIPPLHQRSLINGVKKVRFSNIVAERNAIWLQIDTMKLPPGVDILSLVEDKRNLTNVSASLRHQVQGAYDVEKGAWLCIERGAGVRGIPQEVTYNKAMKLKPKNAHGLTIPLGETVNSKRIYRTLKDFPHLLVGGATGQGKTSYLNVILAAIIENNTPADIGIVLVDLKGGIEFEIYRGLPHLWKIGARYDADGNEIEDENTIAPEGIVGRSDRVIKLLERLKEEGERRLKFFKKEKVTSIDEYNAGRGRAKTKMQRIMIVFDEWARVSLGPNGKQANLLLSDITATYRAVGFHVILATQTPTVQVVSRLIKTNFNARLAFGVPDITGSIVILDNKMATNLSPVGRAIFKMGIDNIETQVPYLKPGELRRIIAKAKADGGMAGEDHITTMELVKYSLDNLDGSLSVQSLYDQFNSRIGWNSLTEKLKTLDDAIIPIAGREYIVAPGAGSTPRRLVPYRQPPPGKSP